MHAPSRRQSVARRPRWVWPLLAIPPGALALALVPPTLLSGLLVVALLALPFLRRWLERPAAAPAATDPPGVLQLAWLAGGAERALDVAMTRLLGLGALQWAHDGRRAVWLYRPVPGATPPAELALLHRLCAGGAEPWQLQLLTPGALGAAQWALVERGWWVDRWTSGWARVGAGLPLALVALVGAARLPGIAAVDAGALPSGLLVLAVSALLINALWAPERTRAGTRVLAAARVPESADPLETLCWRVAREGPAVLAGTPAEAWWQIRRSGGDRRP